MAGVAGALTVASAAGGWACSAAWPEASGPDPSASFLPVPNSGLFHQRAVVATVRSFSCSAGCCTGATDAAGAADAVGASSAPCSMGNSLAGGADWGVGSGIAAAAGVASSCNCGGCGCDCGWDDSCAGGDFFLKKLNIYCFGDSALWLYAADCATYSAGI